MEPLAALSVAANVIQLVDYGTRLIRNIHQLHQDGQVSEDIDLQIVTKDLRDLNGRLQTSAVQRRDQHSFAGDKSALVHLVRGCNKVADEVIGRLSKLSGAKHKSWDSFRLALKSLWTRKEIEAISARLESYRDQLVLRILVDLRDDIKSLSFDFNARLDSLQKENKAIITNILKDHATITNELRNSVAAINQFQADRSYLSVSNYTASASSWSDMPYHDSTRISKSHFENAISQARLPGPLTLQKRLMRWLQFRMMHVRHDEVDKAHEKTFRWIFHERRAQEQERRWSDLVEWLESCSSCYWVNGKAGSGKSTLMKYIVDHPQTHSMLSKWAGPDILVTASFFFWNSGTTLQKSHAGLLRSILLEVLQQRQDLIPFAFPDLSQLLSEEHSMNKASAPVSAELDKAFLLLIRQKNLPVKLAFFIDGLDEYNGDHTEMASFLKTIAATYTNVKLLISSRPIPAYDVAFSGLPRLRLQDLTHDDIKLYVQSGIKDHYRMRTLFEFEPDKAVLLMLRLIEKAEGVFLWVKLVVQSLTEGLENYDCMSDLLKRLEELPLDLEGLYRRILQQIPPRYLQQAARLIQIVKQNTLVETHYPLRFQELTLALEGKIGHGPETISPSQLAEARRYLSSRCRGLLEAHQDGACVIVRYMHQTVKEFLSLPDIRTNIQTLASGNNFDPNVSLCKQSLILMSGEFPEHYPIDQSLINAAVDKWKRVVAFCRMAEQSTGRAQTKFVEKLDKIMTDAHRNATSMRRPFQGDRKVAGILDCNCHWSEFFDDENHERGYCWYDDLPSFAIRNGLALTAQDMLSRRTWYKRGRHYLDYAVFPDPVHFEEFINPDMVEFLLEHGARPNDVYLGSAPWRNALFHTGELWLHFRARTLVFVVDEERLPRAPNFAYWSRIIKLMLHFGADPKIKLRVSSLRQWVPFSPAEIVKYAFIDGPLEHAEDLDLLDDSFDFDGVRKMGEEILLLLRDLGASFHVDADRVCGWRM
jgi:hypothetical protein